MHLTFFTLVSLLTLKECKNAIFSEDDGPLDGGFYPMDSTSPEVQEVVRKSVKIYESRKNTRVVAFSVDKALAQVVAGTKYKIKLKIVHCRTQKNFGKCDDFKICLFEILDRPWTSTFTLKASCKKHFED